MIEGRLIFEDFEGRKRFETLIWSEEHGARVIAAWAAGECPELYQAASGSHHQCARPAGHEGLCSHRMERGD